MKSNNREIEISLDQIFPNDCAYSFLVGSGISVDAPSNLSF